MRLKPLVKNEVVDDIIVDENIIKDFEWLWNNLGFCNKIRLIFTGRLKFKTEITS